MNTATVLQGCASPMPLVRYDDDPYEWAMQQAELLRSGHIDKLDIDHLIEEIENMVSSDYIKVMSHLRLLLTHLLKWEYQPHFRKNGNASWEKTIRYTRDLISRFYDTSNRIKKDFPDMVAKEYVGARKDAARETRLDLSAFPEICPWTNKQLLDEDFFPGIPVEEKQPEKKKKGAGKRKR